MNEFRIYLTTDGKILDACAQIMCATSPWTRYGFSREQCRKAFEGEGREVYVLESASSLQGFIILQMQGTFKGYIQTLCVDPASRAKGRGTALLQFAENRIRQVSPNLFICVSDFNTEAARLYFRFGFEKIGELRDFLKPGIHEWLLRKSAGPVAGYVPPAG